MATNTGKLLISASSKENAETKLREFYYSPSYYIEDNLIKYSKGINERLKLVIKKGRYLIYML